MVEGAPKFYPDANPRLRVVEDDGESNEDAQRILDRLEDNKTNFENAMKDVMEYFGVSAQELQEIAVEAAKRTADAPNNTDQAIMQKIGLLIVEEQWFKQENETARRPDKTKKVNQQGIKEKIRELVRQLASGELMI